MGSSVLCVVAHMGWCDIPRLPFLFCLLGQYTGSCTRSIAGKSQDDIEPVKPTNQRTNERAHLHKIDKTSLDNQRQKVRYGTFSQSLEASTPLRQKCTRKGEPEVMRGVRWKGGCQLRFSPAFCHDVLNPAWIWIVEMD